MAMKLFVTGGAGFIGSHFVKYLLKNSTEVEQITVYDALTYAGSIKNLDPFFHDPRLKFVQGNILDLDSLRASMVGSDFVVHFAAESHVDRSIENGRVFTETNVTGSFNVFSAAMAVDILTIIHVSTDEVYGSLAVGSATEESMLKPNSPYAASKAASDLIARSMIKTHGLDIRITRCSNNYGSNQNSEKLIPKIIYNIQHGMPIPIFGDGSNIREWIEVTDHCRAIEAVLKFGQHGETYNVGTGIELSNLELVELIMSLSPPNSSQVVFVEDRKGHDFRYSLNSDKIKKLGFKPNFSVTDGLSKLIRDELGS
jgi:dTDP-glucose 4,6-dehydratase